MMIKNKKGITIVKNETVIERINKLDFELEKGRNSGEAIEFNFKEFIEKMYDGNILKE